jgi:citrate lyase subunit beta/citryl-CoA lyase
MTLPITYLFVPGNRPERFDKALAAGADAVILDLEDAVAPRDKDTARASVAQWLAAHRDAAPRLLVRINDRATPWFAADLDLLAAAAVQCAMLPKTETAAHVAAVSARLPAGASVLPLIETARGLKNVDAIAAAPSVQRLAFGTLDFGVDLDLSGDERGLVYPSSQIALASRCAGIGSPVAGVTPSIDDEARLLADLAFARAFGFGAKLCIHPKQVAAIRKALQPTAAEVDWARRVTAAAEGSEGAVQVDGRMVDRPVLLKAQSILALAAG